MATCTLKKGHLFCLRQSSRASSVLCRPALGLCRLALGCASPEHFSSFFYFPSQMVACVVVLTLLNKGLQNGVFTLGHYREN